MTIYTTTVLSASTIFDFDVESTILYVAKTGALFGTGVQSVVQSTEVSSVAIVHGEIGSENGGGIYMTGDYAQITVGATGVVSSNGVAIDLRGAFFSLNNLGVISGAWAVEAFGQSGIINNAGSIVGTSVGSSYWQAGVYLIDATNDATNAEYAVNNTGTITGNDYAIYTGEDDFNTLYASNTTVNNSGTLFGGDYGAVFMGLGADVLVNSGLVIGAVDMGEDADTVVNSGRIDGDVRLGGGADVFDGRGGTVNGLVLGGMGDDTYFVDDDTTVLVEQVGEGSDQVQAWVSWTLGAEFEVLSLRGGQDINGTGSFKADVLDGNSGDNTLRGLGGKDFLYGNEGDDRLVGNRGNDALAGGSGDDILRGGLGNDTLSGEDGNDVLIGGMGKDTLAGGDGSDAFRFDKIAHSPNTGKRDTIADFTQGEDLIDLSGIIPGPLAFIGTSAFGGTGQGEVRVTLVGGNSMVRIDRDGDGTGDMLIKVDGISAMTDLDFLL